MIKTSEKVLIAVLAVVFIGMASAFIAALNAGDKTDNTINKPSVKVLYSDDIDENEDSDFDENEEQEVPITGSALDKASSAALEYIGQGRVTDSEVGDEEGFYEIEITLDNGREVDVHLDENFNVLSVEYE